MSLNKTLFRPQAFEKPQGLSWDAPADAIARWAASPRAEAETGENTISILDAIGYDPWMGGGVTAKDVGAALRAFGSNDVTVNINSPGGDVFEGLAIYSLLADHPAKVTVNVLGLAASAASIVAAAGDVVNMGLGTFLMIHNAWGVAVGDTRDMTATAKVLASIDGALADIYVARSGQTKPDVMSMMNADTYMNAQEAVENGFADAVNAHKATKSRQASTESASRKARRQVEASLAQQGYTRAQRAELISNLSELDGAPRDASPEAPRDASRLAAALAQLTLTIRS